VKLDRVGEQVNVESGLVLIFLPRCRNQQMHQNPLQFKRQCFRLLCCELRRDQPQITKLDLKPSRSCG
jgi:hypothetical protein